MSKDTLSDLIAALEIFKKYRDKPYPTHCEHDEMLISGVSKDEVSPEDAQMLDELGFFWFESHDCWGSFRFGS